MTNLLYQQNSKQFSTIGNYSNGNNLLIVTIADQY